MGYSLFAEKQAESRCAALLSIGMCLLWLSLPTQAQIDPGEQQDALREYPSLAIAGSPLHEKFLELYRKAVANHSDVLKGAEGPLLLAREAAAILCKKTNHSGLLSNPDPAEVAALGFPLQATTLFVPYSTNTKSAESEKMSAGETAKWQSENGYRLTLAVHFFADGEGKITPAKVAKAPRP